MSDQFLPFLPECLITECILIRLPVKSVGRFRCVSKPWRSLLSSPQFAREHLEFHTHHEPEGAILAREYPLVLWTLDLANGGSSSEVTLPLPLQNTDAKLVGSCHGLLLIRSADYNLILFNPTTSETVEIPSFSYDTMFKYGLGYDSSKDDYKIVLIISANSGRTRVVIYSVRTKTWSLLGGSPCCTFVSGGGEEFVNGCIHLVHENGSNRKAAIAAFSFERDEFGEVPLPRELDGASFYDLSVAVLGGRFTVAHQTWRDPNVIKFWVMKEYGDRDSWTKHAFWRPEEYDTGLHVVGALGEDEFLVKKSRKEFVAYNWRSRVWRAFHGISEIGRTMAFRESLISPNYS